MEPDQMKNIAIKNCYNFEKIESAILIEQLFYLMNVADIESLDAIYNVLDLHPCELVRHEAAFTLGEVASIDAARKLKEVYAKDNSLVVKHECLMSLGTIGSQKDLKFILPEILEPMFEIQCSAKIARDRINQSNEFSINEDNLENFQKIILDDVNTSQNDRIQLLFQLMNLATPKAIEIIFKVLKEDRCRIVRHEAAFTLGEIGTDECKDYLISILDSEKTDIVIHEALFALGTTGDIKLIPIIEKFITNQSYVISESAKIARDRINMIREPYSGYKFFK